MLENIAVLALLFVPVLAWGNTARLLARAGHKRWLQHLSGLAIWFPTALGVLLLVGGVGAFDESPTPILAVIGGLFILAVLSLFFFLGKLPHKPSAAAQPTAKEPAPPAAKFTALTKAQRKTLPKAKPLPPQPTQPAAQEPYRQPTAVPKKPTPPTAMDSPVPTSSQALKESGRLEDKQKADMDFSHLHPDSVRPQRVQFEYENSNGEYSTREVLVDQVGSSHFSGFCSYQTGERTFRFDRIVGLALMPETGEMLDYKELRDRLRGYGENELRRQRRAAAKTGPEILFTGFKKERRAELEELAEAAGMSVRKRVTEQLDFLCCGPNAGPSKVRSAELKGCSLLLEEGFLDMLDTEATEG